MHQHRHSLIYEILSPMLPLKGSILFHRCNSSLMPSRGSSQRVEVFLNPNCIAVGIRRRKEARGVIDNYIISRY